MQHSVLKAKTLELMMFLGWMEEERRAPQLVWLDFTIRFASPPLACQSDNLADTVCYDAVIQQIKKHVAEKSFCLIEHAASDLYTLIKNFLPKNALLQVELHKRPAIENLNAGVVFTYGDAW